MKKLALILFAMILAAFASCTDGLSPASSEVVITGGTFTPIPQKFDAPAFVSVTKGASNYEVKWKPVPGAVEYIMFVETQYSKQLASISPVVVQAGDLNGYIMRVDFSKVSSSLGYFDGDSYRFAVAAISYDGLISDLVFSNVINRN